MGVGGQEASEFCDESGCTNPQPDGWDPREAQWIPRPWQRR